MEHCNACQVFVQGDQHFCPLCGTELTEQAPPAQVPAPNQYPDLSQNMKQYHFYRRMLLFFTFFGCGFSVLVNLIVNRQFLWCLIVVATAVYGWATIPPMLRRGANYAAQIVLQVLLLSALVIALDYITGYRGWSFSFVVPALLSAGILVSWLMTIFNRTLWGQYVVYQVIMGVFGFVPLVLYFAHIATNLPMVLVTAGLSLATILITVIFADRSVKSEFIRRFHI